jgi:uncharacterized protein with NRDE domain
MDVRGVRSKIKAMCALVLLFRQLEGVPIFVGANRDEAYDRPAAPPGLLVGSRRRALAPRDRRAGGTWIGFNDAGVVAAVTNRPGAVDSLLRSRGEIVPLALDASSARDAREAIEARARSGETASGPDNPFQALVADASEAFLLTNDGSPTVVIAPGVHLLTNEHGLDRLSVPALDRLRSARSVAEADAAARELLTDHTEHDHSKHAASHRFCKHGDGRGTVSSSMIWLPAGGIAEAQFLYAAGPPCRAPFQQYSNLVRRILA